jgi:hypothetical protein
VSTTRLPLIPADDANPCFGCITACCREYEVELSGFDLWRLVRGLDVTWQALAEVRRDFSTPGGIRGFLLDESAHRYSLWLRRRRDGACITLVELPGQQMRCGAHDARPLPCRIYPYDPTNAALVVHALCPPAARQKFETGRLSARPAIDAELIERAIWLRLVRRWNERASAVSRTQRIDVEELLSWVFATYDRLAPLRASSPPAAWMAIAGAFIDGLEMPALVAGGY